MFRYIISKENSWALNKEYYGESGLKEKINKEIREPLNTWVEKEDEPEKFQAWVDQLAMIGLDLSQISQAESLLSFLSDRNLGLFVKLYKEKKLIPYILERIPEKRSIPQNADFFDRYELEEMSWSILESGTPEMEVWEKYYEEELDTDEVDEDGDTIYEIVLQPIYYTMDEMAEEYNKRKFIHPFIEAYGDDMAYKIKNRAEELANGVEKEDDRYGTLAWSPDFEECDGFRAWM